MTHGAPIFNGLIIAITRMDERAGCQISEEVYEEVLFFWYLTLLLFLFERHDSEQFSQTSWFIHFPTLPHSPTPSTDYSLRTRQELLRGRTCWGVVGGVHLSPCPIKFHQKVPRRRWRTLVWGQSQCDGRRFPSIREMASSTITPYFTKLKIWRKEFCKWAYSQAEKNPQTADRCCRWAYYQGRSCGGCPSSLRESLTSLRFSENRVKACPSLEFLRVKWDWNDCT